MSARYIEINLKPGFIRHPMGKATGPAKSLGGGKMTLKISADKRWELIPPFNPEWRYYVPDYPAGKWSENSYELTIYGQDGTECFAIRKPEQADGLVFYGETVRSFYPVKSTWRRAATPLKPGNSGCWSGLALKGSAGVVIEGEEICCLVGSWDNPSRGAWFNILSARLGLVGGFSGGVALVIVTGFPNIDVLNGHSVSGWDWTVSLGAKLSGFAKFGKSGPMLLKMVERINKVEDLVKTMKGGDNSKELIGIGKSAYDNFGYDFEEQNVTVIDIPLAGAGAEMGVYMYYGSCKLFSKW